MVPGKTQGDYLTSKCPYPPYFCEFEIAAHFQSPRSCPPCTWVSKSDRPELIAADEYAIVYQCSAPPNASNIGDITFNIHFDHTELHSQQSFNLDLTTVGRYNITGEEEIFDENFEIEVHQNSILLSRFRDQRTRRPQRMDGQHNPIP